MTKLKLAKRSEQICFTFDFNQNQRKSKKSTFYINFTRTNTKFEIYSEEIINRDEHILTEIADNNISEEDGNIDMDMLINRNRANNQVVQNTINRRQNNSQMRNHNVAWDQDRINSSRHDEESKVEVLDRSANFRSNIEGRNSHNSVVRSNNEESKVHHSEHKQGI